MLRSRVTRRSRSTGCVRRPRARSIAGLVLIVGVLAGGVVASASVLRPSRPAHGRSMVGPPPDTGSPAVRYAPPVAAPVVDPFRPPSTPYGPGNRGIEYGTVAGTEVGSAAAGRVTFAGRVAGSLDVTVLHADGIRTSYVGLATIRVKVGQQVRLGEVLGTTGTRLHVGARSGDDYLDPASLWSVGEQAVLVPLDGG